MVFFDWRRAVRWDWVKLRRKVTLEAACERECVSNS